MAIKTIVTSKQTALSYDKATFNIKTASDLIVQNDISPRYIIENPGKPSALLPCKFEIKIPPVGSDAIFDIKYTPPGDTVGGITTKSVFNAGGSKVTFADGIYTVQQTIDFDPTISFELFGRLSCDVTQIGSTTPGQCAVIVLYWIVGI